MKLGVSYMVFDGVELLRYNVAAIRSQADFVSVVYQNTSYFGNEAEPELEVEVGKLKEEGLVDMAVRYDNDLSLHHKINEINIRNLGLSLSKEVGCTHHASLDVDEFYVPSELEYAKKVMEDGDFNYSIATMEMYYKQPTYRIVPRQGLLTSFIHPVHNEYRYDTKIKFPYPIETTRRHALRDKPKYFSANEVMMHHMSYVRKDIRRKLRNSDNGQFYKHLNQFFNEFDEYKLGGKLYIVPDFAERKTKLVDNIFGISL